MNDTTQRRATLFTGRSRNCTRAGNGMGENPPLRLNGGLAVGFRRPADAGRFPLSPKSLRRLVPMEFKGYFSGTSLCVVGNINRDVKTTPFAAGEQLLPGRRNPGFIDHRNHGRRRRPTAPVRRRTFQARTAFLGKIGNDALGRRLEQTLTDHSISAHLARGPAATGTSINLNFTNGHRHFVSCLANNESLRVEDLDLRVLTGYRHLLRADIWFSEPMLEGGNEQLSFGRPTRRDSKSPSI